MSVRQLTDTLSRPVRDLRLSVTDRCNFRCAYCMPRELFGDDYAFMPRAELLTFEEMSRLVRLFTGLGVQKVRLTGGEPLLRKNLNELIQEVRTIPGVQDIGLTTNGLLLGQHAESLYEAGLRRLNISLDALTPSIFGQLNGRGVQPEQILKQIEYAQSLGYRIKINMVVQKGINDEEILPMAEYFRDKGITLRFIEFMDAGSGNGWSYDKVVTQAETLQQLQSRYDLVPADHNIYGEVATYYRYRGTRTEVGFITSVSRSFCSSCTRARLSSDGKLYTCLFASSGYDLRQLVRGGAADEELQNIIADIWEHRTDRYSDLRTAHTAASCRRIGMSYIGG